MTLHSLNAYLDRCASLKVDGLSIYWNLECILQARCLSGSLIPTCDCECSLITPYCNISECSFNRNMRTGWGSLITGYSSMEACCHTHTHLCVRSTCCWYSFCSAVLTSSSSVKPLLFLKGQSVSPPEFRWGHCGSAASLHIVMSQQETSF